MKILHIDTSILDEQSVSKQITASIVKQLSETKNAAQIIYHDLASASVDHLSKAEFLALAGIEPQEENDQQNVLRNSLLLDEFLAADIIVIGAPMYNFSLPTQLKAWLDRIAVAGKTFQYTATGAQGLAGGKQVIIASTRGGLYSENAPAAFLDHQESYLRGFFGFIGITDITFIRAEGLSLSPETRTTAIEDAQKNVKALVTA